MNLHHMVVDDFFEEPWELRNWALEKGFRTEKSPVDGMDYVGVCKDPPWIFNHEAEVKLSYLLRSPAQIALSFLRLTTLREHDAERRIVHLDHAYAKYVCTVYLNPVFPEDSGTWILRHWDTGLDRIPTTQEEIDIWTRDCNSLPRWEVTGKAVQHWNRTIIMPTDFFHASRPTEGFGDTPETGRMVFVAFFNI